MQEKIASAIGLHLGFSLKDIKDGLDVLFLTRLMKMNLHLPLNLRLGSLMVKMKPCSFPRDECEKHSRSERV